MINKANTNSLYRRIESWLLLLILTLIWGSSFILIKKGLDAFSPEQVASLRIVFAFAVLIPFLPASLKRLTRADFKYIAVSGIIGNLVTSLLFSVAQTKIESAVSGALNALTPVFTIIFASMFFKYQVKSNQVIGILLGLAGAMMLSFVSSGGSFGAMNSYAWLIVLATICYALNVNILKSKLANVDSKTITSVSMFTIVPVCIVYLLFSSDFIKNLTEHPKALNSTLSLAVLGIFSTAVGLVLYNRLIKLSSPVFASSVAYLLPIVAVLWGLWDGEQLFPLHYISMTLIIAGVLLANKSPKRN